MLTHLQQSNSHPCATCFVRAPLCFASSPTVLEVIQGPAPPQCHLPVTLPRSSKACQGERPARDLPGALPAAGILRALLCAWPMEPQVCGAYPPLHNCTWLNPKWRGHLAPSVWRTQGGRHLAEKRNRSQAAPCRVPSRDVPLLPHIPSHLTYQGHCGTGPLIHQRPDNLQSPGRNIREVTGIKDP